MPIPLLTTLLSFHITPASYLPVAFALAALVLLHVYARGASNTRLRDMHARTVLLTGGLTPLGLTVLESLAVQGARVLLLEPPSQLRSPLAQLLIPALRARAKNPEVHLAECDLASPASVRAFVARFAATAPGSGRREVVRVDEVVLCHAYGYAGGREREREEETEQGAFALVSLLLPLLLRAPATRDIRLVHVVNPFYAAAFPRFPALLFAPAAAPQAARMSPWQREGMRALRGIVWVKHLQRVLDALVPVPTAETAGESQGTGTGTGAGSGSGLQAGEDAQRRRRSNVLAIAVCPGFSRSDIVAPYLGASSGPSFSLPGLLTYIALYPLLLLLLKSPGQAAQSVLFAMYAPLSNADNPAERVRGGELIRECRVVRPPVGGKAADGVGSGEGMEDWGGEAVGRKVWEGMERAVGEWERAEKERGGDGAAAGNGRLDVVHEEAEGDEAGS